MIQKLLFFFRKFVPAWAFKAYHFVLAFFGHALYGFPSRKLIVIGVTGTNGKTTTSFALAHILKKAGFKVAVSSSARFQIGDRVEPNLFMVSMPGRFKLAKFLSDAVHDDCQVVIVESTSEGVLQYRHRFIAYDYFVVTNLRPEHIEHHGSFEKYKEAKLELVKTLMKKSKKVFRTTQKFARKLAPRLDVGDVMGRWSKGVHDTTHDSLKQSSQDFWQSLQLRTGGGSMEKGIVVNLDDEYASEFLETVGDMKKVGIGFREQRTKNKEQNIQTYQCGFNNNSITYQDTSYKLQVPGLFNAYNIATAAAAAVFFGTPFEKALSFGVDFAGVPGRFEVFRHANVAVVVDYAHEPFSLEQVLTLARQMFQGVVVHVFGATGGGRDIWKRSPMGEVSGRLADKIMLTNDDPYDEDQEAIANEIRRGVSDQSKVELVLDRKEAIRKGIEYARERGGVVVVTGKGTENLMCFERGRKIPWSDREVVTMLLHSV